MSFASAQASLQAARNGMTSDIFDAAAYLRANPDITASSWNGGKSPWQHYLMYGQNEGRLAPRLGQASSTVTPGPSPFAATPAFSPPTAPPDLPPLAPQQMPPQLSMLPSSPFAAPAQMPMPQAPLLPQLAMSSAMQGAPWQQGTGAMPQMPASKGFGKGPQSQQGTARPNLGNGNLYGSGSSSPDLLHLLRGGFMGGQ